MNRFVRWTLATALSILAGGRVSQTLAANHSWNVSSGTWSTAGDWNPSGVPFINDNAWVVNGGTATIASGVSASCGTLALGGAFSGSVQLVSGGSLTVPSGGEYIGNAGTGVFTQTGGANSSGSNLYLGFASGSSGSYTLSGNNSLLWQNNSSIGYDGSGTFTQNGGSNSVASEFYLAQHGASSSGIYYLNGGTLNVGRGEKFGTAGTAAFSQSSGINLQSDPTDVFDVGASATATYNLSGGSLFAAGDLRVGDAGRGTFNQTGGTVMANTSLSVGDQPGGIGTYILSGGSLASPWVLGLGIMGVGNFVQTGGTNSSPVLRLGIYSGSTGTYSLSGGLLNSQSYNIGLAGSGSFTQSGGTNVAEEFVIAWGSAAGSGAYTLTGGSLGVQAVEDIGEAGTGRFIQSGGTNSAFGLSLGDNTVSNGSYGLNGGLLLIGNSGITLGPGGAAFKFGGGTLGAILPWSSTINMNLTGSSVVDASGGSIALSGVLSGTGGLTKVSPNTLALVGSNSYSGGTTISGGTLQLGAGGTTGSISPYSAILDNATLAFCRGNTVTQGIDFSAAAITGTGGIVQLGPGTLTLEGPNTYTGPTSVNGGELVVEGANGLAAFIVNSGGTLQFNGATENLASAAGSIRAAAGGTVQYFGATVFGGYLRGPGTHTTLRGTSNYFNGATTYASTIFLQNGNDTFTNFTNGGQVTNIAPLVWDGGENNGGGSLTVTSTVSTDDFTNAGVITINRGGAINNHLSDMTSYGGGQIYVNAGGTLNANSQGGRTALDLQDSLLVNNGRVNGTTNVYYGATVSGSGSFGPINVLQAGAVVAATSAVPAPTSLTVTSGSITGAGSLGVSATVADAIIATPNLTDVLTLSGNLSGRGPITKIGAGTLLLSGTNTFGTGTNVGEGTLIITTRYALPDGSDLTVGNVGFFAPVVPSALDSTSASTTPVPEPGTLALLGVAVSGAAIYRRLRVRRKGK